MTNLFAHPEQEFLDRTRTELRDYWDHVDYSSNIISLNKKTWFIKSRPEDPESKNREVLASLLGGSWLNIPEVRLLTSEEFQALRLEKAEVLGEKASEQNTYLVRLAQDYKLNELPIPNFDDAIASEIAFSSWILRRDAHAANRVFVHGIPMFFDFHIAFGAEVEDFFRGGPDGGYVGNWHLWQIKSDNALSDIPLLRLLEFDKGIAAIPFIDKNHFEDALFRSTECIKQFDKKYLYRIIKRSGFSERRCSQVYSLLEKSSDDLDTSIDKVLSIISSRNVDLFSEDYLKDELIKYYSEYKSTKLLADRLFKDLEAATASSRRTMLSKLYYHTSGITRELIKRFSFKY